ncbi:MAG: hypothetical protein HDR01_04155 [Lachnospiraceae bacterium]|nr:hypothetical protein [Lachnospiraceae bacterium]
MDVAYRMLQENVRMVPYFIPVILFMALYAFNVNKLEHMEEIVCSVDRSRELRARRWALFIWNLAIAGALLFINAAAFFQSHFKNDMEFLRQMILYVLANYLAVGMVMILAAEAVSLVSKVKYQVLLAVFITILFGGYCKEELYYQVENKELFYKLYALLQIITPGGGEWGIQQHIGLPIQIHQVGTILFWGMLFGMIVAIVLKRKKKFLAGVLLLAVLILMLPYEELGQSYYGGGGTWYPVYHYYDYNGNEERIVEEKEKQPEFAVTDYEMEFHVFTCLYAEVTMHIREKNLEQYQFTLYHPYRVMDVRSQDGEKLAYERDGDYLTVYPSVGKTLEQIKLSYYGNGKELYSQMEGINLMPGTCFYPMAGFQKIYGKSEYGYGFYPSYLQERAHFQVKVITPRKVYSTLTENGKNSFEGEGDTFGLFAGLLEKTVVGDTVFIHPRLEWLEQGGFSSYEDVVEYAGLLYEKSGQEAFSLTDKTVIVLPSSISMQCPVVHDHYLLFSDSVRTYEMDYLKEKLEAR